MNLFQKAVNESIPKAVLQRFKDKQALVLFLEESSRRVIESRGTTSCMGSNGGIFRAGSASGPLK